MTREEAITIIRKEYLCVDRDCDIEKSCGRCDLMMPSKEPILQAYKMAMQVLEQEPYDDAKYHEEHGEVIVDKAVWEDAKRALEQEPKTGHCKDCKHFRKLPMHTSTIGKCIQHMGLCPKGDWYCADFEPQESEVSNG